MPRVTISFDLPDERHELFAALRAETLTGTLDEIDRLARCCLKYGGDAQQTFRAALVAIRTEIREATTEHGP